MPDTLRQSQDVGREADRTLEMKEDLAALTPRVSVDLVAL